MRTLLPIPLLAVCTLLLACPPAVDPDAGPGEGEGEGEDAGTLDAGDAGQADAGHDAGGALDAGADAGWVCGFPPIPRPADAGPDAGAADCTLQSTDGTGHFEGTWDGRVWGTLPLAGAFDLPASGTLAFDVVCGGDKLLVSGALVGEARSSPDAGPNDPTFPFGGPLWGEFDLASGGIEMIVDPASLTVGPFTGTFRVSMTGVRANDAFDDGVWCGDSIEPVGGNGEGSWTATLR